MTGPTTVAFLRGTGRCGTTMLVRQLGLHPDVAPLPLDEVLPEELVQWCARRLPDGDADDPRGAAATACRAFLASYARSTAGAAPVVLHKGTMKVDRLERLLAWWPEARIVYLVRHPLGVVPSMINADVHRFRGRFGYRATVANSLLRWANDVIVYTNGAACGHPRVLQVAYERLVAEPDAALAAIHRFLGVEPSPWAPVAPRERYETPFVLTPKERDWIVASTRELVARLGYDADAPPEVAIADDDAAHVGRRLGPIPPALDGADLLAAAVRSARARGCERLAVLGAGYLARLVLPRLDERHDAVTALIDEDPAAAGARVGRLVVSPARDVTALDVDAVVPLTLVHQPALVRRWLATAPELPIVPLWSEEPWMAELVEPAPARPAGAGAT